MGTYDDIFKHNDYDYLYLSKEQQGRDFCKQRKIKVGGKYDNKQAHKGEDSSTSNAMLIDVIGLVSNLRSKKRKILTYLKPAMIALETVKGHFEIVYEGSFNEFNKEETVKSASMVVLGKDKKGKKTVLA